MVKSCYRLAVGHWGVQPSEFWGMTPKEWWWLWDIKRPRNPELDYAGSLTHGDVVELLEFMRDHG